MPLYYIETDYGCGIREAKNLKQAWNILKDELVQKHAKGVRLATEQDIKDVRSMGGYVPTVKGE